MRTIIRQQTHLPPNIHNRGCYVLILFFSLALVIIWVANFSLVLTTVCNMGFLHSSPFKLGKYLTFYSWTLWDAVTNVTYWCSGWKRTWQKIYDLLYYIEAGVERVALWPSWFAVGWGCIMRIQADFVINLGWGFVTLPFNSFHDFVTLSSAQCMIVWPSPSSQCMILLWEHK